MLCVVNLSRGVWWCEQLAVAGAHECGLMDGEKPRVAAAFSPDALTVAGLLVAEMMRCPRDDGIP